MPSVISVVCQFCFYPPLSRLETNFSLLVEKNGKTPMYANPKPKLKSANHGTRLQNCLYECTYDFVQLWYTVLHSLDVIMLPNVTVCNICLSSFMISVRSMSPPTRDVTSDDKMSIEIFRLTREVTKCLQQIKNAQLQNSQQRGSDRCFPTQL